MKRPNYLFQIKERISAGNIDAAFVPSDFFDIADSARVGICLRRLTKSGVIMRVMRGVYAKPYKYRPNVEMVAQAIARNYGWTIAPCGDAALYLSKMTNKSPDEWTFVSDGTYQSYDANGVKLVFKHAGVKNELNGVSDRTALYIQALRAIGKNNITNDTINDMAAKVAYGDIPKLSNGTQRVTAWIKTRLDEVYEKAYEILCSANSANLKEINKKSTAYQHATNAVKKEHINNEEISTFFGFSVKSRAEALIAVSLHMAGLDYIYEKRLSRKEGKPLRPDFTIKYKSRTFIWEHLGKMHDKGYAANWYEKKKWYDANIPEGQLLTTDESGNIGAQIDNLIKDIFNIDVSQKIKNTQHQVNINTGLTKASGYKQRR